MYNENYPKLDLSQTLEVSRFVQNATRESDKNDLVAISCAIFNRLPKTARINQRELEEELTKIGEFSLIRHEEPAESCLKSLSIVAGVLAGLYEDPTRGATRFHRHDHSPGWSKNLRPCALLGPYLYFRD